MSDGRDRAAGADADRAADAAVDEGARRRLEVALRAGRRVRFEAFAPPAADPRRRATLVELACIALEHAWRAADAGAVDPPEPVERLLERVPELREPAAAGELFVEELRLALARGAPADLEGRAARWRALGLDPAELARRIAASDVVREVERERALAERAARRAAERELPATIGRWVVRAELGRGSFARVYRAHDPRLGRDVAVKVLRGDLAEDERMVERFWREGRSAARLSHPGVVPVHEVGEADGRPFLVTELVAGPTLAELLERGPADPRAAARWVADLADALHYAHQLGVVHRDVKPANVLMSADGRPRLGDFGLALSEHVDAGLTRAGDVVGTPAYMSPEQARGEAVAAATDVYGLGAVLYHALCGRPPFEGRPASVLERVKHAEPPPPRRLRPALPLDLETICLVAMAKEPARRYASAGALAADLRRWLAHEPVLARRPGPLGRTALWCRRNPSQALTLAAAALLVLLVGAVAVGRVVEERDRFRRERDVAQANLYRALVGEARSQLEARGAGWRAQGLESLRQAAALEVAGRDATELRELAGRILSAGGRSFRRRLEVRAAAGAVTAVACDPLGRVAASGDAEGRVRLWDLADGALRAEARAHGGAVRGLAFHPRGHRLASAGADGALCVWSVELPAEPAVAETAADAGLARVARHELGAPLHRVRAAADGRRLATGAEDGSWALVEGWEADAPIVPLGAREGAVTDVAFSPDGALVAGCAADVTVAVHAVADGELVLLWDTSDPPSTVAFTAERTLVYATPASYGFVRLHVDDARSEGGPLLHKGGVRRLAATPDGGAVSVASDGAVKQWTRGSFEPEASAASDSPALDVGVDRAGRRVVVGHADGVLRAWEIAEPEVRRFWDSQQSVDFLPGRRLVRESALLDLGRGLAGRERRFDTTPVRAVCPLPGPGERAAVGTDAGAVRVVDLATGVEHAWSAHPEGVTALAARADGARLATGGRDGEVEVRETATGALRARLAPGVGALRRLVWLDAPERVLALGPSAVVVLAADGAAAPRALPTRSRPTDAVVVGGRIAVGTAAGAIALFDARTLAPTGLLDGHRVPVAALAALPRSGRLVSAPRAGAIVVWDLATHALERRLSVETSGVAWLRAAPDERVLVVGEPRRPLVLDLERDRPLCRPLVDDVRAAAFGADPRRLLLGLGGGAVRVLDLDEAERARHRAGPPEGAPRNAVLAPTRATAVIGAHAQRVWGVAASPDGESVATCDHGGVVQAWDATRRTVRWSRALHAGPAWSVRFDAASRRLASASLDVIVWDAASGEPLARLPERADLTTDVAFLPGGPWLAASSLDGSVLVWDLERGAVVDVLHRGPERVHELALAPDGTRLAAAVHDGRVRVWDLAGFAPRGPAAPPRPPARVLETGSPAWAVRWRGDGGLLAAGAEDGGVSLWETAGFARALRLAGDVELVRRLAFSTDGGLLAASCFNRPVVIWDLAAVERRLAELGVPPAAPLAR